MIAVLVADAFVIDGEPTDRVWSVDRCAVVAEGDQIGRYALVELVCRDGAAEDEVRLDRVPDRLMGEDADQFRIEDDLECASRRRPGI